MKNLTSFRIGLFMLIFQLFIFILFSIGGKFNFTGFICVVYWAAWTIFYWNQRGKKCQLRIIPLDKNKIEIGDLVKEVGFPLAGIVSGVSTCLTPGGSEYSPSAKIVQLVVIDKDEGIKTGEDYITTAADTEIKKYDPLSSVDPVMHIRKVILFQKDMSEKFIGEITSGKVQDRDDVLARKNKVFREKYFYDNKLMMGLIIILLLTIVVDVAWSVINIFETPEAKIITGSITGALIATLLFFAIRKYRKLFKNK